MPELPEVESVRRGLAEHVAGRRVVRVSVLHPRAVRRHLPGAADLEARLTGRELGSPHRRGKYLWVPLSGPHEALVAHLGMSGQLRIARPGDPTGPHLRVTVDLDDGTQLRFVDQRTFGGLHVEPLVEGVPPSVVHIARDPFDPAFDLAASAKRLRGRRTELERALLDQTLVSGIGNIYADESLWRVRLHPRRMTGTLRPGEARGVLVAAAEVMAEALAQGGTSFDALYVRVNGESGYFDRSLEAYGREGEPCSRCGTSIRRESFTNRSSFFCPRCQRAPRSGPDRTRPARAVAPSG